MDDLIPKYCIDTDVLIQSKNGPYGFDIVPSFWEWLEKLAAEKIVFRTWEVYEELKKKEDELAQWSRKEKVLSMFIKPDKGVTEIFPKISNYVSKKYSSNKVRTFLVGADPWVIAHAKAFGCLVVSHETRVDEKSFKIKIPNVCREFGVEVIKVYEMLRRTRFCL